jgi:excinuclease UvrABC nuclease subunit
MDYPILHDALEIIGLDWQSAQTAQELPLDSGVYMLVNKFTNKIEYVGESVRLRYRISNRDHPAYAEKRHKIKYLLIHDNDALRHYLEYRLIELLEPQYNQRSGKYPKDIDQGYLDANYDDIFG